MTKFPRFIQDKPQGIDKFDGASQEALSKAIAKHIKDNDSLTKDDCLPRIIGIEGVWGAGKSNVVKLIEKHLQKDDSDYFFLNMMHGAIKKICNAGHYWSNLPIN